MYSYSKFDATELWNLIHKTGYWPLNSWFIVITRRFSKWLEQCSMPRKRFHLKFHFMKYLIKIWYNWKRRNIFVTIRKGSFKEPTSIKAKQTFMIVHCLLVWEWCQVGQLNLKGLHKTFWGTPKKCENKNLR